MRVSRDKAMMTLENGDTVCVLGGGPGGASCAIALKREAQKLNKEVRVVIFEQKSFRGHRQYNQCIGVLSPPLETILKEELGVDLTKHLLLKEIEGYCLHSDVLNLNLDGKDHGKTYAVSRVDFDALMLEEAEKSGAEVYPDRATGLEFAKDSVLVYGEGENCQASVLVGAFGLDEGSSKILEQATRYRPPEFLNTIITRLYPDDGFLEEIGPTIHAFLLSMKGVEFGAVTPKRDHLSINIAGKNVSSKIMLEFLRSPSVQKFLPPKKWRDQPLNYFKGKFPIAPAKNFIGDRYVTIGDAAGLIRPFKGKGINSACLTGIFAAKTIMNYGVSRAAFQNYLQDCSELTADLWYGRVLRGLTNLSARVKFMDRLLKIAEKDPVFMDCLFNCVSGQMPYRKIFKNTISINLGMRFVKEIIDHFIFRNPVAK